jgi:uncharacterized protein (DUF342 family)
MITGLFIDVSSVELKSMLEGRLKFHQDKVEAYTSQLEGLEKLEAALGEEAKKLGKGSTATPKDNMLQTIQKHSNQVIYYKFMAEHVVPSETYRLGENDLMRLGVQSDRMYG